MLKKKVFLVLSVLGLVLAGCATSDTLLSGELWACEFVSFFDVLTAEPPHNVRFTCRRPEFAVEFILPDDPALIAAIRDTSNADGMGIVLNNGQLVQLFLNDQSLFTYGIVSYWPPNTNR